MNYFLPLIVDHQGYLCPRHDENEADDGHIELKSSTPCAIASK